MDISYNRTKIVCTIGPASSSEEALLDLIKAGMDVARLNFSHGTHDQHLEVIKIIRKLNKELGTHVSLLGDLQGPKIRIGLLKEAYPIEIDQEVILNSSIKERDGNILPIQYKTFAEDVNPYDLVLVDDGKVQLQVLETNKKDTVKLKVIYGDEIGSRKGVNLPLTNINMPSITEKDWKDAKFAIKQELDWIALSFVRTAREVLQLKKSIEALGGNSLVISKVEKPEALKNIDEIVAASDGIMIARGDMGVEIQLEDVPMWQKTIIRKCNAAAKPVIVATQMMESMIDSRRPSRAEASDVANAVMDGADALMLSGETSVGKWPSQVVASMERIISSMEEEDSIYYRNMNSNPESPTLMNDKLIIASAQLAKDTEAEAVIGMTVSGYTAFQLSKCRPKAHIFIFTENPNLSTKLNLVWGVRTFYYDKYVSTDETISDLLETLKNKNLVQKDDVVINTGSMPIFARQRTNFIKMTIVD